MWVLEVWVTSELEDSNMYFLHKCFKQASLTPSSTSAYSFLTKKDVESANENVETALAEKPATTRRVATSQVQHLHAPAESRD